MYSLTNLVKIISAAGCWKARKNADRFNDTSIVLNVFTTD